MLAFPMHPKMNVLTAKCRNNLEYTRNNNTVTIHLVHGPDPWNQQQIVNLEQIVLYYPQAHIDLISIRNPMQLPNAVTPIKNNSNGSTLKLIETTTSSQNSKTVASLKTQKRWQRLKRISSYLNINIGPKKLLKSTSRNITSAKKSSTKLETLNGLLNKYPCIHLHNTTYSEVFQKSSLYLTWHKTNEATRLFAIRVLQMWNYAGISFDLMKSDESGDDYWRKHKRMIAVGLSSFKSLPSGLVTIDEEGAHMETKTTCHAFFGEILMALENVTMNTKPADVIRQVLNKFCKRGTVDNAYCLKV